jgi:hypothetical protein
MADDSAVCMEIALRSAMLAKSALEIMTFIRNSRECNSQK